MAIEVVRQKKVYHVPEAGIFVVEGSNGDKYSVQLYPKESCSCPSLVASQIADSQFAESQIAESN